MQDFPKMTPYRNRTQKEIDAIWDPICYPWVLHWTQLPVSPESMEWTAGRVIKIMGELFDKDPNISLEDCLKQLDASMEKEER